MATRTCGECNGAGYFGRLDWGMTCSTCHGNGYINSNRAPDPIPSGSATGGTADLPPSPAVPPTHSNPVTAVAREASATGQGGVEVSVTAPPEPDIPTFLDRRNRA